MPQAVRFFRMMCMAFESDSTKVTSLAPRLNASMPTAPVPAYRSKKRQPGMRVPRIENRASLTLSEVGRNEIPRGPLRRRPRWEPAMTRIRVCGCGIVRSGTRPRLTRIRKAVVKRQTVTQRFCRGQGHIDCRARDRRGHLKHGLLPHCCYFDAGCEADYNSAR